MENIELERVKDFIKQLLAVKALSGKPMFEIVVIADKGQESKVQEKWKEWGINIIVETNIKEASERMQNQKPVGIIAKAVNSQSIGGDVAVINTLMQDLNSGLYSETGERRKGKYYAFGVSVEKSIAQDQGALPAFLYIINTFHKYNDRVEKILNSEKPEDIGSILYVILGLQDIKSVVDEITAIKTAMDMVATHA
jgi:hypothetical protein